MIKPPRLLDKALHEKAVLHPTRLSATDKLDPTSTATMGLPKGEPEVSMRDFVELYDEKGSKGIYRVEGLNVSNSERQTVNLSHGIVTLEDTTLPDDFTLSGTIKSMIQAVLDEQETQWWQLGTVQAPEDETYSVSAAGSLALQALVDIAELVPEYFYAYDQSTTPWTLHFMQREDTPSCECRLSRNISSISISFSSVDMCTRVTSDLLENGYMDADTVDTWGIISRELDTEDDTTEAAAVELAEAYLDQYKNPSVSIEIDAFDLANRTNEPLDALILGKLCRVALPDWGITQNHQIISVYYADLLKKPEQKKISLSTRAARAETALAQAAKAASQSSKNYKHIIETDKTVKILAEEIDLKATKTEVEAATVRISNVEIGLSAAEARIDLKADRTEYNELEKRVSDAEIAIDGANAQILLKASQTVVDDLGTRVSAAEIEIDGMNSEIALKADKIDLQGLVTATELETVKASISNLTSGLTTATVINSNTINGTQVNGTYGSFDSLTHNGALVSQRNITMGSLSSVGKALSTGGELDLQHSHAVTVSSDGVLQLGEVTAEGGNFNIADTQFYKNGVAAAANAVYFVSTSWSAGRLTVKLSNDRTKVVTLTQGTATSDNKIPVLDNDSGATAYTVDASDVYQDGYDAGAATGGNVTLSKKWANGVFTVTASNGQTATTTISKGTESLSGNTYSIPIMYDTSGKTGYTVKVDASARYDAGYDAGWAAAVAKIALDGNVIKGPGSTVDSQETLYTVTAGGSINSITNTAANYMFAEGYGRAYINGTQVDYKYISKGQSFNLGQ